MHKLEEVLGGSRCTSLHRLLLCPSAPPPFTSPLSLVLPFLSRSSSSHSLVRLCSDLFHLCVFLLPPPFSTLLVTCQGLPSFFFFSSIPIPPSTRGPCKHHTPRPHPARSTVTTLSGGGLELFPWPPFSLLLGNFVAGPRLWPPLNLSRCLTRKPALTRQGASPCLPPLPGPAPAPPGPRGPPASSSPARPSRLAARAGPAA